MYGMINMKRLSLILFALSIWITLCSEYNVENMKKRFQEEGYSESEQMLYLGGYQYTEGHFEDAISSFIKSKELGLPDYHNTTIEMFISLTYMELREHKKALEHIDIGMDYDHDYAYESIRLIIKHKLSENIEIEKKDLIKKWILENEVEQYLICDFLLKIEDYSTALLFIKDYEIMLKEKNITMTNLHYIFYAHTYFELKEYEKSLKYINLAKEFNYQDSGESYLYYWEALTNYKLGYNQEAYKSLQKGTELGWDYHGRFMLLQFWRFSEKNIETLEKIEILEDNGISKKHHN